MTLKTYIKKLQALHDQYPNAKVVYSSDDEGNSFHFVGSLPTVGHFDGEDCFIPQERIAEWVEEGEPIQTMPLNAVCIN